MNGHHHQTGTLGRRAEGRSRSRGRVILFLAGLLVLFAVPTGATIPTSEREALIALYDSTAGQYWYYSYGWLGPVGTECSWDGVYCDPTETTVETLYLPENFLVGSLPPEIGNLAGLSNLILNDNYMLEGQIPPEIWNLTKLQSIYLPNCSLSGPLPPEISNLVNLRHLNLDSNHLDGAIPSAIGNLSNLRVLGLRGNRLTGAIPPELGMLQALEELDVGYNLLSGAIPIELFALSSLVELKLDYNQLTGPLPPGIAALSALEILDVSFNRLSGAIPSTVGGMASLTELYLQTNDLNGPIPPELGNNSTLRRLVLRDNRLSGQLPETLGSQPNLEAIYLAANKFSGEIPASIGLFCDNGGYPSLDYNSLFTNDPDLAARLDHCAGLNWRYQGEPPSDIAVLDLSSTSATLEWIPITWTQGGVFEVLISTESGGPYERVPATSLLDDKGIEGAVVAPLLPNTTYYAVVRSVSYPSFSRNTIASRLSNEVVFTTPPANTVYTSTTGDDQNDCLSPATPCRTIQAAVDRAVSGDVVSVGPGLFEENLTIDRSLVISGSINPPTIIDGLGAGSTVVVASDTTVALQSLQITNGRAPNGAGVFNNGAILFILDSEIAGNRATFDGGGIFNESGLVVVENSTIADNTAGSDAAVASGTDPAGDPAIGLRNSTVSRNTSTDIFSRVLAPSHLMNSTIADNRAGLFGFVLKGEATRTQHTIIAGNHSPACNEQDAESRGHNLADDDGCFPAEERIDDLIVADVGLGPLGYHGGPTRTHELLPNSPAIDTGDNDGAPILDQRGVPRPVDGDGDGLAVVDLGAVETSGDPAVVFRDGFETGDTSRWSAWQR